MHNTDKVNARDSIFTFCLCKILGGIIMRPEVKKFIIGVILTIVVVIYRDPIIATLQNSAAEVKSWFHTMETKPRQSQRASELEEAISIGTEQAGDE